jgi:hypothetical protein
MIFLTPGSEGAVVSNMAAHLRPGGVLIAGFQLQPGKLSIDEYDGLAIAAGLRLRERWSTWDRDGWERGGNFAVSVHERSG